MRVRKAISISFYHLSQVLGMTALLIGALCNGIAFADQGTFMGVVGSYQKSSGRSATVMIIVIVAIIVLMVLKNVIRKMMKTSK